MCEALRSGDKWIAELMRQHREEFVALDHRFLEHVLGARAFADFRFERLVGARQFVVGAPQVAVELLELARLLRLQRVVGLRQRLVRIRQLLVDALQLAPLGIQLHQHRDLAAQDLRDHRDVHVVDGAGLVALEPVELGDVHAGHEDDRDGFEARMVVNELGGFETVHARHLHVEQHHREFLLHERIERFEAGVDRDEVVTQRLEDGAVGQQPRRLVIHHQDIGGCAIVHGCNHIRTSDRSCPVFTGLAT